MASPVNVAVTGAAGQIGYALLFRVASGQMLGPDTPVHLSLLEIPDAVKAAEGTAMELEDCAFPLLSGVDIHDDAASAANAAVDHVRDWMRGTPDGDWVSMSVCSDGSYDVEEGLISSFPCTCSGGEWSIVEGLEINDFARGKIEATVNELRDEREAVTKLDLL